MEYADFNAKILIMNQRSAEISKRTGQMALVNCANPNNPDFVQLMNEYLQLTQRQSQLIAEMMGKM
jgi:hypothetical protein